MTRLTADQFVALRVGQNFGLRKFPRVRQCKTARGKLRASSHRTLRAARRAARALRDRTGKAVTYWKEGSVWWVGIHERAVAHGVTIGPRDGGRVPF